MRSIRQPRYAACVVALVIATDIACGGGDRTARETPRADDRPVLVEPAPTPPPSAVTIDVGGHPGGIVSAGDGVWVTVIRRRGDYRVVRIDGATNKVVASTPVDGNPFEIAAGEGAVWVTGNFDEGGDVLYRIDTQTNRVAATIRFPGRYAGPVATGEGAVWLLLTDRGRTSNSLARIDPMTNTVERIVPLDGALGRYVDELAVGQGAVWLLALRLGKSAEQPGDVIRFDPQASEVAATIKAEALNLGVGPGGVWVTGCVDCDQHRDTFFAQEIDPAANAPVGPRIAVDRVAFSPLLVATDSVWFSGYGAEEETVAFRLDPETHAIDPFLRLGGFLHSGAALESEAQTLWVAAAPRSVVRSDIAPDARP